MRILRRIINPRNLKKCPSKDRFSDGALQEWTNHSQISAHDWQPLQVSDSLEMPERGGKALLLSSRVRWADM